MNNRPEDFSDGYKTHPANNESGYTDFYHHYPSQDEDNTNLYRTLLTANLFGIATAGATLSIDPDLDSIFLHKMLYNGLSYSDFETQVEFFIKVLRHWKRQILENPSPTEEHNVPFYSLRI